MNATRHHPLARWILAGSLFCASSFAAAAMETSEADAVRAIEAAEQARQEAAAIGAEWLETGRLIEQARQAAAEEDWGQAIELSGAAEQQARLALEQAEREAEVWQRRVVR